MDVQTQALKDKCKNDYAMKLGSIHQYCPPLLRAKIEARIHTEALVQFARSYHELTK